MNRIAELKDYHSKISPLIRRRLKEFEGAWSGTDEEIFRELCFCVLTANTSAEMSLKAMDAAGEAMIDGSGAKIRDALRACGYRYPGKRAEYIAHNREHMKHGLAEKIASCADKQELRDYLVENVKGFGYKEASHFMRNIGFKGLAILDKHILSGLAEFNVINTNNSLKNKREYLEIERKMKRFAEEIGIDMDELDLLLWSRKTGKLLK